MRIAIVEDNRPLADGLAKAFESDGHGVDVFYHGDSAEQFLTEESVDLVILDVNLPGKSGLEILKSLRDRRVQTPILILTARSSMTDKVDGLDLGADDYLQKPFDLGELKARARALLRRGEKSLRDVIRVAQLEFDPDARQLKIKGAVVELPRRELALAEVLIQGKDRIISKSQIFDHLYGVGADSEDNAVELYVHRLRKRIAGSGTEIKTARGLGYCFRQIK